MLPKWITPMIIGITTKMLIKNYVEVISVSGIGLGRSKLNLELNYVCKNTWDILNTKQS